MSFINISLLDANNDNHVFSLEHYEDIDIRNYASKLAILTGLPLKKNNALSIANQFKEGDLYYYTKSPFAYSKNGIFGISVDIKNPLSKASGIKCSLNDYRGTIRPVLKMSPDIFREVTKNKRKIDLDLPGVHSDYYESYYEVDYCAYPQDDYLDINVENGVETGNTYTINALKCDNNVEHPFVPLVCKEYQLGNDRFIKVVNNNDYLVLYGRKNNLYSESYYHFFAPGETYYIKVEPITWIVDEENCSLIGKKCLLSGIRFDSGNSYNGNFKNTEMNHFLQTYMFEDILQNAKDPLSQLIFLDHKISSVKEKISNFKKNADDSINKKLDEELKDYYSRISSLDNSIISGKKNISSLLVKINKLKNHLADIESKNIMVKKKISIASKNENQDEEKNTNKVIRNIFGKNNVINEVTDYAVITNTKVGSPLENDLDYKIGSVKIGKSDIGFGIDGFPIEGKLGRSEAMKPLIRSDIIYEEALSRSFIEDGKLLCYYGEYPQLIVAKSLQKELNNALKHNKNISLTGEKYTLISYGKIVQVPVYLYNNKKYVFAPVSVALKNTMLSNGIKYSDGDYAWVEVKPVRWIIDEKTKSLLSFYGLVGNVPATHVNYFHDEFLIKEIIRSESIKTKDEDESKRIREILVYAKNIINELKDNSDVDKVKVIKELDMIIKLLQSENVDTSNLEMIMSGLKR